MHKWLPCHWACDYEILWLVQFFAPKAYLATSHHSAMLLLLTIHCDRTIFTYLLKIFFEIGAYMEFALSLVYKCTHHYHFYTWKRYKIRLWLSMWQYLWFRWLNQLGRRSLIFKSTNSDTIKLIEVNEMFWKMTWRWSGQISSKTTTTFICDVL